MIYRVSARGLLIENGTVLFIEYRSKDNEVYYSLPGGGQETNIDLSQTLKNEFLEEVGLEIFVGDVLLVREFIISNPKEEIWKNGVHQLEIIFDCKRVNDNATITASKPDHGMIGTKWIPIDQIKNHKVYPTTDLIDIVKNRSIHYLLTKD